MKATAVIVMMIVSCFFALAQQPGIVTDNAEGWKKIGETTVSFKEDNESIVVIGADEFEALKLKVTDAPIEIERLEIFYESGEMEEVDVASELKAGAETEEFQLKHNNRDIQKVSFTYRSAPDDAGEKAHVELHGLKTGTQRHSDGYRNEAGQRIDSAVEDGQQTATEAGQELNDQAENIEDDIEEGGDRMRTDVQENTDSLTNEVSKAAANTAAGIADEVVKDQVAPAGQTVYLDKEKRFYYISDEGKKVFIERNQLKNKTVD